MDRRLRPCSNLAKTRDSRLQRPTLVLLVMRLKDNSVIREMRLRAEVLAVVCKTVSVMRSFANTKEELNTVEKLMDQIRDSLKQQRGRLSLSHLVLEEIRAKNCLLMRSLERKVKLHQDQIITRNALFSEVNKEN